MMSGWRVVPISELYEGLYDGPHATPKPANDGPVFLGIKNVTEDGRLDLTEIRHIAEEDFERWTRRVAPRAGDLVLTYEATLNRYALIPTGFRGCLGRRMALIRPDTNRVNPKYLFHYFFTPEWREVVRANTLSGATVDRLPLTRLPDFPVRVPDRAVQDRLAAILSAYDELIENCELRIRVLDDIARALYREWFVLFRYPGHEKVPVIESPVGSIPEGWGPAVLDDLFELQRGFDLPESARKPGDVPIVAATGINGTHCEAKAKAPGVVTGRSGSIGTVIYLQEDYWPLNTTLWIREFRRAVPLLAFFLLESLELSQFNSGAAVPTLNRNDLRSLAVVVPPQPLQERFQEMGGAMFRQRRLFERQISTLRRTRDLLLPRLLSGKIDLRVEPSVDAAV